MCKGRAGVSGACSSPREGETEFGENLSAASDDGNVGSSCVEHTQLRMFVVAGGLLVSYYSMLMLHSRGRTRSFGVMHTWSAVCGGRLFSSNKECTT